MPSIINIGQLFTQSQLTTTSVMELMRAELKQLSSPIPKEELLHIVGVQEAYRTHPDEAPRLIIALFDELERIDAELSIEIEPVGTSFDPLPPELEAVLKKQKQLNARHFFLLALGLEVTAQADEVSSIAKVAAQQWFLRVSSESSTGGLLGYFSEREDGLHFNPFLDAMGLDFFKAFLDFVGELAAPYVPGSFPYPCLKWNPLEDCAFNLEALAYLKAHINELPFTALEIHINTIKELKDFLIDFPLSSLQDIFVVFKDPHCVVTADDDEELLAITSNPNFTANLRFPELSEKQTSVFQQKLDNQVVTNRRQWNGKYLTDHGYIRASVSPKRVEADLNFVSHAKRIKTYADVQRIKANLEVQQEYQQQEEQQQQQEQQQQEQQRHQTEHMIITTAGVNERLVDKNSFISDPNYLELATQVMSRSGITGSATHFLETLWDNITGGDSATQFPFYIKYLTPEAARVVIENHYYFVGGVNICHNLPEKFFLRRKQKTDEHEPDEFVLRFDIVDRRRTINPLTVRLTAALTAPTHSFADLENRVRNNEEYLKKLATEVVAWAKNNGSVGWKCALREEFFWAEGNLARLKDFFSEHSNSLLPFELAHPESLLLLLDEGGASYLEKFLEQVRKLRAVFNEEPAKSSLFLLFQNKNLSLFLRRDMIEAINQLSSTLGKRAASYIAAHFQNNPEAYLPDVVAALKAFHQAYVSLLKLSPDAPPDVLYEWIDFLGAPSFIRSLPVVLDRILFILQKVAEVGDLEEQIEYFKTQQKDGSWWEGYGAYYAIGCDGFCRVWPNEMGLHSRLLNVSSSAAQFHSYHVDAQQLLVATSDESYSEEKFLQLVFRFLGRESFIHSYAVYAEVLKLNTLQDREVYNKLGFNSSSRKAFLALVALTSGGIRAYQQPLTDANNDLILFVPFKRNRTKRVGFSSSFLSSQDELFPGSHLSLSGTSEVVTALLKWGQLSYLPNLEEITALAILLVKLTLPQNPQKGLVYNDELFQCALQDPGHTLTAIRLLGHHCNGLQLDDYLNLLAAFGSDCNARSELLIILAVLNNKDYSANVGEFKELWAQCTSFGWVSLIAQINTRESTSLGLPELKEVLMAYLENPDFTALKNKLTEYGCQFISSIEFNQGEQKRFINLAIEKTQPWREQLQRTDISSLSDTSLKAYILLHEGRWTVDLGDYLMEFSEARRKLLEQTDTHTLNKLHKVEATVAVREVCKNILGVADETKYSSIKKAAYTKIIECINNIVLAYFESALDETFGLFSMRELDSLEVGALRLLKDRLNHKLTQSLRRGMKVAKANQDKEDAHRMVNECLVECQAALQLIKLFEKIIQKYGSETFVTLINRLKLSQLELTEIIFWAPILKNLLDQFHQNEAENFLNFFTIIHEAYTKNLPNKDLVKQICDDILGVLPGEQKTQKAQWLKIRLNFQEPYDHEAEAIKNQQLDNLWVYRTQPDYQSFFEAASQFIFSGLADAPKFLLNIAVVADLTRLFARLYEEDAKNHPLQMNGFFEMIRHFQGQGVALDQIQKLMTKWLSCLRESAANKTKIKTIIELFHFWKDDIVSEIKLENNFQLIDQLLALSSEELEEIKELYGKGAIRDCEFSFEEIKKLLTSEGVTEAFHDELEALKTAKQAALQAQYPRKFELERGEVNVAQLQSLTSSLPVPIDLYTQQTLLMRLKRVYYLLHKQLFIVGPNSKPTLLQDLTFNQQRVLIAQCQKDFHDPLKGATEKKRAQDTFLAVLCDIIYKKTKKHLFANATQVLAVLYALECGGNLFSEIYTGEGKSLLSVFKALMQWFKGHTTDILTANITLAKAGYEEFKPVFESLDIPIHLICESSELSEYQQGGVHYSTVGDVSIFRDQQHLHNKMPTGPCSGVVEEWDALTIDDLTIYRLAIVTLAETLRRGFPRFYELLQEFVTNPDYQISNVNNPEQDVEDFIRFMQSRVRPDEQDAFETFKANKHLIDERLNAAIISRHLQPDKDFIIRKEVERNEKGEETTYWIARIVNPSTGYVYEKATWKDGVHQLLQVFLQLQDENKAKNFLIPPETDSITAHTPEEVLRFYPQSGGQLLGSTSTLGNKVEISAGNAIYHGRALRVPYHGPNHHYRFKPMVVSKENAYEKTWQHILAMRKKSPVPSILIACPDIPTAEAFYNYIKAKKNGENGLQLCHAGACTQDGVVGKVEEDIIQRAGTPDTITVSTKLGRGAHMEGLSHVIVFDPVDHRTKRQAEGRVARFEEVGSSISVLFMKEKRFQALQEQQAKNKLQRQRFRQEFHDILDAAFQRFLLIKHALDSTMRSLGESFQDQWRKWLEKRESEIKGYSNCSDFYKHVQQEWESFINQIVGRLPQGWELQNLEPLKRLSQKSFSHNSNYRENLMAPTVSVRKPSALEVSLDAMKAPYAVRVGQQEHIKSDVKKIATLFNPALSVPELSSYPDICVYVNRWFIQQLIPHYHKQLRLKGSTLVMPKQHVAEAYDIFMQFTQNVRTAPGVDTALIANVQTAQKEIVSELRNTIIRFLKGYQSGFFHTGDRKRCINELIAEVDKIAAATEQSDFVTDVLMLIYAKKIEAFKEDIDIDKNSWIKRNRWNSRFQQTLDGAANLLWTTLLHQPMTKSLLNTELNFLKALFSLHTTQVNPFASIRWGATLEDVYTALIKAQATLEQPKLHHTAKIVSDTLHAKVQQLTGHLLADREQQSVFLVQIMRALFDNKGDIPLHAIQLNDYIGAYFRKWHLHATSMLMKINEDTCCIELRLELYGQQQVLTVPYTLGQGGGAWTVDTSKIGVYDASAFKPLSKPMIQPVMAQC